MSDGNRIAGVAIVVILLLALFVGYGLGRIDSSQRIISEHRHQDACRDGDYARCETKPIILEPSGEQRPADPYEKSYRDEYRAESDLAAQWTMAKWARGAFFASLVGIALLFVTWQATAQGVRETRKIGEKQVQAYLMCNEGQLRIRAFRDANGQTQWGIACNLIIANKGQSPAKNVDIRTEVWLFKESTTIRGTGSGYFDCRCVTFCADVAPSDKETAIIELPLFSEREFKEFEQVRNWLDIRGEMIWTNEFGNEQRQALNLASPKFWAARFFPDGNFDPSIRIPLVGIGRRTTKIL